MPRIFLLFLLLSLCACVREEIVDDLEGTFYKEKLVIQSILSPGDSIFVYVGKTLPYTQEVTPEAGFVFDAKVTLQNSQGTTITLPLLNPDIPVYAIAQPDFPILPGETYHLSVLTPHNAAKATCTVPAKATEWESVNYKGTEENEGDTYAIVQGIWKQKHPSTYLERVVVNLLSENVGEIGNSDSTGQHDLTKKGELFSGNYNLDTDYNNIGHLYTVEESFFKKGGENTISYWEIKEVTFYLITPDQHLSGYTDAFDKFYYIEENLQGNELFSLYRGIIPEYTNIEGGWGVFGAYLVSQPITVKIPE